MSEIALLGKKIGMTREFYKSGQLVPVTVLKVEKARVIQVIEEEKRGYKAVQLGYGKIKNSKLTKAMKGVFAKKNTEAKKKLKEFNPNIKIVGVDQYGSILGGGTEIHSYKVEGIGYDFFPDVLDNNLIDEYIKVNDKDSFQTAKKLIKEEGLFIGGSSGSAVWAGIQAAKQLDKDQNCLIVLPDSIRNYLSGFVDDQWLSLIHI